MKLIIHLFIYHLVAEDIWLIIFFLFGSMGYLENNERGAQADKASS